MMPTPLNSRQSGSDAMHNSLIESTAGINDSEAVFSLYSKLPPEIKRKLWKLATQGVEPRLIAFARQGGKVPAVLHACHLSRLVAAPTYTFLKYREHHLKGFNMPINFEIDTVNPRSSRLLPGLACKDQEACCQS